MKFSDSSSALGRDMKTPRKRRIRRNRFRKKPVRMIRYGSFPLVIALVTVATLFLLGAR